jgi:hypothetical protein
MTSSPLKKAGGCPQRTPRGTWGLATAYDQPAAAAGSEACKPQPRGGVRGGEPNEKPGACRQVMGALTPARVLGHDHEKSRRQRAPSSGTVRTAASRPITCAHRCAPKERAPAHAHSFRSAQ